MYPLADLAEVDKHTQHVTANFPVVVNIVIVFFLKVKLKYRLINPICADFNVCKCVGISLGFASY